MADLLGRNSVMFYGTVNTTPSTQMVNWRKPKNASSKTMADNSRHAHRTKSSRPVREEKSIEFEMVDSDTDADVAAFRVAYENDTPLAIKALNKASGKGCLGDFEISKFESDQDEESLQIISVSLVPNTMYRDVVAV